MKYLITSACLALTSSQAIALSCMAPDIAQTYLWAEKSENVHAVLLGQISYDETGLSEAAIQDGVTLAGPVAPESKAAPGPASRNNRHSSFKGR